MPLDADLAALCQYRIAGEPGAPGLRRGRQLSLTIMPGLARRAISSVISRTTPLHEIDVSGTAARHFRVTSSTAPTHPEPRA